MILLQYIHFRTTFARKEEKNDLLLVKEVDGRRKWCRQRSQNMEKEISSEEGEGKKWRKTDSRKRWRDGNEQESLNVIYFDIVSVVIFVVVVSNVHQSPSFSNVVTCQCVCMSKCTMSVSFQAQVINPMMTIAICACNFLSVKGRVRESVGNWMMSCWAWIVLSNQWFLPSTRLSHFVVATFCLLFTALWMSNEWLKDKMRP